MAKTPTARQLKRTLDAANRWRASYSPLRHLTMPRAVQLMEAAQQGRMAELQWLYAAETGIESTDPDLMVIIERTLAAISSLDWQIAAAPEDMWGYDKVLADDQAAFLRESFSRCDNLSDALEHLALARFRGFAHVQPWLRPDWTLEHLEALPQHNMLRDGTDNSRWAWNPDGAARDYASAREEDRLDPEEYIAFIHPRSVNRIGLIKYIRASTAEKDWDAYVEIYGIPGVFVIMPPNVPSGEEAKYLSTAEAAAEAGSGALPHGSDVKTLAEARALQPFGMRLEWLQKQLVLAGTGGLLTMLAEAGSGTLAGGAHAATWREITQSLAYRVADAVNRQYVRRALAARFPGRPALCGFELRPAAEKSVTESIESIAKLGGAGYAVDPAQIENETGYRVTRQPAAPALPFSVSRAEPGKPPTGPGADPDGEPGGAPILRRIAALILDGSLPMEEALKRAAEALADLAPPDPARLEADLAAAMAEAAAGAIAGNSPKTAQERPPDEPSRHQSEIFATHTRELQRLCNETARAPRRKPRPGSPGAGKGAPEP